MALLSMDQPFTHVADAEQVTGGTHPKPVFRIHGADGSRLVVKLENTSIPGKVEGLRVTLKTARTVDPTSAGKMLTPLEVQALNAFVTGQLAHATQIGGLPTTAVAHLDRLLRIPNSTWFKMRELSGLIGLDELTSDRTDAAREKSVAFVAALNGPGGFETLGRVLAADLFNHNMDRFNPRGSDKGHPVTGETFKVLVNLGNVVVGLSGGARKPLALDPFESGSSYGDLSKTVSQLEKKHGYHTTGTVDTTHGLWAGRYLKADAGAAALRREFAEKVVADLLMALAPTKRRLLKLRAKSVFVADAVDRIVAGMDQAVGLIRARVQQTVGKQHPPAGLASRLAIVTGAPRAAAGPVASTSGS